MSTGFNHKDGRTLKIGDAMLYVEERGQRKAAPMVLLHGGMGDVTDFDSLVEALGATHDLVGIDARGHGRSTLGSVELTYEQLTRDVIGVADALGLDRFSVLGFSDGGIVGYRLALDFPQRITHLVTLGAPYELTEATARLLASVTPESWDQKFPQTRARYESLNPEANFSRWLLASRRMWLDRNGTGYPGEKISAIQVPTLIVRGDDDHLFSMSEAVELRQRIAPAHLLNVPFAGHAVAADRPRICASAIDEFFARQRR